MALAFDPEIAAALAAGGKPPPPPARGDWRGLRETANAMLGAMAAAAPVAADVSCTRHHTAGPAPVELRWYQKAGAPAGAAVLYIHGGGMICGNLDIYHPSIAGYVAATGVPMLAVEYRLAPEHPHPAPVQDCYAALAWLADQAEALQVDAARIAVMGDSAGGGLAAAVALMARDRRLPLARQILIYPMLDDRNTKTDPLLAPFAIWSPDDNFTGWTALLGPAAGGDDVPAYAAPGRATDLSGVAPAYIEVGELDIFRDEDIDYARRIALAGISVELHVHPGAPHGFDALAPQAGVTRRAFADRYRVLRGL